MEYETIPKVTLAVAVGNSNSQEVDERSWTILRSSDDIGGEGQDGAGRKRQPSFAVFLLAFLRIGR